jgi:hypothetical protein
MSRGVLWSLLGGAAFIAVIALAGCSHFWSGEREAWRREAEVACINSGAVKETSARVRMSSISGPGMCGADYPLRVSALGDGAPLGYDDEPLRPPGSIPNGSAPRWPLVQSNPLPPPQRNTSPPPPGRPLQLTPSGLPSAEIEQDVPPRPRSYERSYGYDRAPRSRSDSYPPQAYPSPAEPAPLGAEEHVPLGPSRAPFVTGAIGPVEVKPPATLACPLVSALDQWVSSALQPAAMRWFRQPVVEIKQISAYSCRGMNGNPNARISEHAFGNALDIAEFVLADGRRITVQHGWRGTPEEQGFLHDIQAAACDDFSTVLAPGANIYHYNHIHVDLMRRSSGRRICEPAAIPGEVVAERARARYAAQHSDSGITGSIRSHARHRGLSYTTEDDDRLPLAIPGDD